MKQIIQIIPPGENLSAVLITHSDADHCGGAAYIRENTGALIFASEIESLAMRKGQMSRKLSPKWYEKPYYYASSTLFSVAAMHTDSILRAGKPVQYFPGLSVLHSPGHTPGHLSFFYDSERILFAGDSIRKDSHGNPSPSIGANTWSRSRAARSFSELLELNPSIIACGHAIFDLREKAL